MSSEQQIQNVNDPEQARLAMDINKIFEVFCDSRETNDLRFLCPYFDETETTSRARSIVHSIFLCAYLTAFKTDDGHVRDFVRAFGSTQIPCKHHPCQFVIGMQMYLYFAEKLQGSEEANSHFVYRTVGTGRNQIHPAVSGCGYYHTPDQISSTSSEVFVIMEEIFNASKDDTKKKNDFFEIPRRINNYINAGYYHSKNIPRKPMQVFQFNGPREKIYLPVHNFNDASIFEKLYVNKYLTDDPAVVSVGRIVNEQMVERGNVPTFDQMKSSDIVTLVKQAGVEAAFAGIGDKFTFTLEDLNRGDDE